MTLGVSREVLHKFDAQELLLNERFQRWAFTILNSCGMFTGYFHSEDAVLAYGEGRRSLGLDILTDLANAAGVSKEEVLSTILAGEIKTQKEVQNGRRNRNQSNRDRNAELVDDPDAVDG